MDIELKTPPPAERYTVFSQALIDLGLMTEIYGCPQIKILSKDIVDKTGIATSTGGEIPRDISQMVISTLNGIGGKVVLIPHDSIFMSDYRALGYSRFEQKSIPDIVLVGGISEFDRGLVTRGKNTNMSLDTKDFADGQEMWFGPQTFGFDYWGAQKESIARIALDFILMDFATLSGLQKIQASNTVEVSKATADKEMAFTLFGPTFGLKGSVKKIQGRHGAIRIMVELSMIQIIGKYLKLPYWRLLPDAKPDPVVLESIEKDYIMMGDIQRITRIQELLLMHGYHYVQYSGRLDAQTCKALNDFYPNFSCQEQSVNKEIYLKLYESVPITRESLKRRFAMASEINVAQQGHLFVETEPANASIRFVNIKSDFYQGMALDPGRYLLEVSIDYDEAYQSKKMWVTMGKDDRTLKIILPPKVSSFQGP
ncbi:MAG: hypothetical protein KJ737_00390 [Proteobacteria bacterium]|nr:hypothetical protein [Pseudomonadota bacterium]